MFISTLMDIFLRRLICLRGSQYLKTLRSKVYFSICLIHHVAWCSPGICRTIGIRAPQRVVK